jgi:dipeptide/tripeptide permease
MADNIINEMERRNINNQMVFKFTLGLIAVGLIFVIIYNIYSAMHSNSKWI